MRTDGEATYYVIQHVWNGVGERWTDTGEGAGFLFDNLTYEQRRGQLGDYYRSLIDPQSAGSALWQRFGINGFEDKDDALRLLRELRALPDCPHTFRLVQRTMSRTQTVVA